eukprot:scaffold883_cov325-Pavlova_lutheri.AAC.17
MDFPSSGSCTSSKTQPGGSFHSPPTRLHTRSPSNFSGSLSAQEGTAKVLACACIARDACRVAIARIA